MARFINFDPEYFGRDQYGLLGQSIQQPSLLGSGTFPWGGSTFTSTPTTTTSTNTTPNTTTTTNTNPTCASIGKVGTWPNCRDREVSTPTCASLGKVGTYPDCRDSVTVTEKQCGDGEVGVWPNCRSAQNLTQQDLFNLFDDRTVGPTTVADVGRVRQDPMTGQTITDTGLNTGDYRLDYSPYGAEERGQGAARGTWNPLSDPADLAARQAENLAAGGILSQSAVTPARLSTQDFLAQYSRPSKTVDQGILSPSQEAAAVGATPEARQRAEEFSDSYEEPKSVPVDDFSDHRKQEAKRQSEAQKSAKRKLAEIQANQAEELAEQKRIQEIHRIHEQMRIDDFQRLKDEEVRRRQYTGGIGGGLLYT